MLSHIFFSRIFKEIKYKFPQFLDDLSKNLDKTPKENETRSIDISINSIKTKPKGFSIKFFAFRPEYNKEIEKTFKDDEAVLSFCIEGQNDSSIICLEHIVNILKETFNKMKTSNNMSYINISDKIESNTLYLDFILKISEIKWVKEFLKFNINFYEYENIDLSFSNNFTFERMFEKNMEEMFMDICSFIFSIKGELKNLQYLLLSLLITLEKYLKDSKHLKEIKRNIYLILAFENMKFNFNFIPEKLRNFLPDDQIKYKNNITVIKSVFEFAISLLSNFFKDCDIFNCVKFEHFLVSFLVAKYNSGFILDINLPGLTKSLIELNSK